MNQEIKAQWIAALRSGDYKQGWKCLARKTDKGTEYCCLGVLCDLAVKAGVIQAGTLPNNLPAGAAGHTEYEFGTLKNSMTLPEEVSDWAGLESSNPLAGREVLGAYNDGDYGQDPTTGEVTVTIEPEDFTQIANRIEVYL